jgi:3,4-dihydroxy 2-butanone 4-phosphate synthase
LSERRWQTELSIELAIKAGVSPSMVVCEMLDDKTGKALSKEDARKYSMDHNIPFVGGEGS